MDSLFTFMVNQIAKLEKELAESKADFQENVAMAKYIEELKHQLAQAKAEAQEKTRQNVVLNDIIEEQIQKITELSKKDYIHSDENLDRLDDIIESQNAEIDDLYEHIDDQESLIKDLTFKAGQLETLDQDNDIQELENENRIQLIIIDKLENTLEKYENQIVQLENQIHKHQNTITSLETSNKEKEYQLLQCQARLQECQATKSSNPLAKSLSETFIAQERNGFKLLFIYGRLQITGRFRSPITLRDATNWRMCLNIYSSSQFYQLLEPYNIQLDDIEFSEAVEVIDKAASAVNRYVGDYSPELVDSVLEMFNPMDHLTASTTSMSCMYVDVVTREYIRRTPKILFNFSWHTVGSYRFAIPRKCEWSPEDVLKMFKHHISYDSLC